MLEKPLSRAQLADAYPDRNWRLKLVDLLDLVSLLRNCIIERNYHPSEGLISAIRLTAVGSKVRLQLAGKGANKEAIDARDAAVLVLLKLVHIQPLVDINEIDIDKVVAAISEEMRRGSLKYPMRFGRDLYDRATELFREERDYLNHEDTLRLLTGQPQGTFQAGHFLSGPFGVFRVEHVRRLGPTTSVPLQHCSDSGCDLVHRIQLTTSPEAGVNSSRPSLTRVLDQISPEPSEWNGFIADFMEDEQNVYEVNRGATIPVLLGDGLTNDELRRFCVFVERESGGRLKASMRRLGIASPLDQAVATFDRAEILQLLMMHSDRDLAVWLDLAVDRRVIVVPDGEVRTARVNHRTRRGAWGLRSDLSRLGVCDRGADSALPLMRLSSLARSVFDSGSSDEMDELAWALRQSGGNTPAELLEEYLRTASPEQVLDTLIMTSRARASRVCDELGIDVNRAPSDLRDRVLWKLGFPAPRAQDLRDRYWGRHSDLEAVVETALVDLAASKEELGNKAYHYFVTLEEFLFDSLSFATWGLLNDHFVDSRPFVFHPARARAFTISTLNEHLKPDDSNRLVDRATLSQLVQGFLRLSSILDKIRTNGQLLRRSADANPRFSARTSLQTFPFAHSRPFLDLLPSAQTRLVASLKAVGTGLGDSGIMAARNGLMHANRKVPSVEHLSDAMHRSRDALEHLEGIGCVRSTYRLTTSASNAWGRGALTLEANGRTITFSVPSSYSWIKLPDLDEAQYLMHGAVFAAPNEMLRFHEGFDSEYFEYWNEFPHRPERGSRTAADQTAPPSSVETGTYAATRAS